MSFRVLWVVTAAVTGVLLAARGLCAETAEEQAVIDAAPYLDPALADCGLQRAIDAAAEQAAERDGATVRIPDGTYRLRRGLVLRDGVRLLGAGMDKTVLVPQRRVARLDVVADGPDSAATEGTVRVDRIPDGLAVGSAVVSCRSYPPAWYGSPRPAVVTAVDRAANTFTLRAPYGLNTMKAGSGCLTFGVAAALADDVHQGDTEVELEDASLFRPGDELALGEPPNESLLAHVFVKEVRGNTLVLEEPAGVDMPAWPPAEKLGNKKVNALVWALFPLVHGARVKDCGLSDLSIRGHSFERVRPVQTRYTLSGIHIYQGERVCIERVAVRDWPSDGISLQAGTGASVVDCQVTGCLGNGLHPGTGLTDSLFRGNLAEENGVGLYFCWHNRGHVIRGNRFLKNRKGGITGLGNPGDRDNVIEENLIAENGGPGIAINGGGQSGNVIRANTIENNSQAEPGEHPGIALYAAVEDARGYTITGNTIRDTQPEPTQHVGIEERHGERRGEPTHADGNVISRNHFSGHRKADVILAGPNTRCEDNGGAKCVAPAGE